VWLLATVLSSSCAGTAPAKNQGMSPRLFLLSLSPLLVASVAHAQAPGEMAPVAGPPAQPVAAPVAVRESVMANRWAIGLSFGGLGVAPEDNPDAKTNFNIGEIALRYRVTRRLELELAVGGGRQVLEDDSEGDLEASTGMLAARYRFMPEHKWNWFLMAGIGGTSIADHDATDEERDAQSRGMFTLGAGIERRFRHFALQAELRGVGLGPRDTEDVPATEVMGTGTAPAAAPPPAPMEAKDNLSGGVFTIGASYYF